MPSNDLPGRYYEEVFYDKEIEPPFPQTGFQATFDSFDVGKHALKIDHTIAVIARLVPLLKENGIAQIFVFGAASHTGGHDFNFRLARFRQEELINALVDAGFPSDGIYPSEPDEGDLHEDGVVAEHKRHRSASVVIDGLAFQGDMPAVLYPPPQGMDDESD